MKKILVLATGAALLWIANVCPAADAPHQVAVFKLNTDIAAVKDYVIMETALPIRYMENIEEVEIKPMEGIKSGLIAYATCTAPGHIVRIKLKYSDSTKNFYEKLFAKFKERFGEPDEYRGDPFHILISWKWSFVDKDGNRISMTLQHNTMDTEEKMGNAVKLTMTNLIDEDQRCYAVKALDQREKLRQREWKTITTGLTGWNLYVPR
ncbi:MAG: hypothetical protein JSW26_01310 [Desulfobacterales bacterium]|nr:MAG: hypothetical protein JSW26_01310 [Desulfobacterales bacterium]